MLTNVKRRSNIKSSKEKSLRDTKEFKKYERGIRKVLKKKLNKKKLNSDNQKFSTGGCERSNAEVKILNEVPKA